MIDGFKTRLEDLAEEIEDVKYEFDELVEELKLNVPNIPDFVDKYIIWQKEYIDENGGTMPMTNLTSLPFESEEIKKLQKWLSDNFETFCLAYATGKYNVIDNTEDLFYVRLPMSYPEAEYLYLCRFDKSDFDGFTYYTKLGDKKELMKNRDFHFTETQIREIDEDPLTFSHKIDQ